MFRRCVSRFSAAIDTKAPVALVECPRDAMQGLKAFVPTEDKVRYINALLRCGFHTLDCGSFVSAPAVPQMRDTAEVISQLDMSATASKLLVVVCNVRGAMRAVKEDRVTYIGYPLSACETFQQKNTNRDIVSALEDVRELHKCCQEHGKQLVVYISMGFGNPYDEPFSVGIVDDLVKQVAAMGVGIISLADTVGVSTPPLIDELYRTLIPRYSGVEFGAHFHSGAVASPEKIKAALGSGCHRLDGALGGMGGCPFAKSTLVGNVSSEALVDTLEEVGIEHGLDKAALQAAAEIKHEVFGVGLKELVLAQVLNDEQSFMDLCVRHFKSVDTDGRGFLSEATFTAALTNAYSELGEPAPSAEKLRRKFHETDLVGDGRVTFEEYMVGVRKALNKRLAKMK